MYGVDYKVEGLAKIAPAHLKNPEVTGLVDLLKRKAPTNAVHYYDNGYINIQIDDAFYYYRAERLMGLLEDIAEFFAEPVGMDMKYDGLEGRIYLGPNAHILQKRETMTRILNGHNGSGTVH